MPQPYEAGVTRPAAAGRPGRPWLLIVLAILAVTVGTALAFGIGTPTTRPREGKTILAGPSAVSERVGRTVDIVTCEPLELQDVAAAPAR